MTVRVQAEDFDLNAEVAALIGARTDIGAVVTFTGRVRGRSDGRAVAKILLEHYPEMTLAELERIEREALARWPIVASLIIHRFGELEPGDAIVLVVTASAHRRAAFEAAEFLMDYLKTCAPFWKKEWDPSGGGHWVEARTTDGDDAGRWTSTETCG